MCIFRTNSEESRKVVESRGIDAFWDSRRANCLRSRPEKIAQALLAVFAKRVIQDKGLVLRELLSGVGFIDVAVILSRVIHLIEIKVLTASLKGASQLEEYMRNENRREGWLVLMDARPPSRKTEIVDKISTGAGVIRTVNININPIVPSLASP